MKYFKGSMTLRESVSLSLLAGTGLLILVMAWILNKFTYSSNVSEEIKYLESSMEQIIHSVELNEIREVDMYEMFEADYLNRANVAANWYSRAKNRGIDWNDMLNVLEVEGINIVDEYGKIVESSNPENIGLSFHEDGRLEEFLPLIEGRSGEESHIQMERCPEETGERKIYVGVKPADEPKGMIQLEISAEALEQYESLVSLKNLLNSIPTERYRFLFALEKETEKLLALSENNEMQVDYSLEMILDMEEGETRTDIYTSGSTGKKWAAVCVCRKGIIYGYASDISGLHGRIRESFIRGLASVAVLSVFVLLFVYWLLGYAVLTDLETITQKMARFINGASTVYFKEGKNREIKELSQDLNKLVSVIETKQKRLCTLANMFDKGVAAYEYYVDLNQIFCSDNLISLTELSEEEVHRKIRSEYEKVKNGQEVWKDGIYREDRYQTKSGRTLMVHRTCLQNASYGFVQDITKDMNAIHSLNTRLSEEMSKNVTDALTGLYNRTKLEEEVRQIFRQENPKGMLVLIDLDNFKRVNDEAGHAEGDKVLKAFSGILSRQFRSTDLKVRLGGDEFVILLREELSTEIMQMKLNQFLKEVRTELQEYYRSYKLSVSIGVAAITQEIHSYEDLYRNADAAMYAAKRSGKDGFYMNLEQNTCMRENCIHCRAVCERRKLLFDEKEG